MNILNLFKNEVANNNINFEFWAEEYLASKIDKRLNDPWIQLISSKCGFKRPSDAYRGSPIWKEQSKIMEKALVKFYKEYDEETKRTSKV